MLKKHKIFILYILFSLSSFFNDVYANYESKIIAKVKNKIITEADINNQLAFTLKLNGIDNPTEEQLEVLYPQTLYSLIDETVYRIHAQELRLDIPDADINKVIASIAFSFNPNYNKNDLKKAIRDLGIDYSSLFNHIKSQLLWQKIIDTQIMPNVNLNSKTIKGLINSIAFSDTLIGFKQLYIDLSEIENKQEIIERVNSLREQKPNCKEFERTAKKYNLDNYINFFSLPAKSLHNSIKEEALIIPINRPSQIIKTGEELRLIIVCARNSANNDKINEISENVLRKKLASYSQTYLMKLRKQIPITIIAHD